MSHANVEIVLAAYEQFNRGDVDSLIDVCAEDFVMDMSERVFNPDVYRGREELRRFYAGVRSVWESYRWDVEETRAEGDSVVALLHCHAQARDGGPPVDWRVAWVWRFDQRRAMSARFYRDPADALKAVGVSD